MGKTITAAGYPGLCFSVGAPTCDCIRATINGVEYQVNAQTQTFNNRKVYYIDMPSGDSLAIAWSVNPNRWELFNRNTQEIYAYDYSDSECPFSNVWNIEVPSYIITSVGFCVDRIYNIAPELEFTDCIPCINCI